MYKIAIGNVPIPKTSGNNPAVIKAYRLNSRRGVLRGFSNGRSIKCSSVGRSRKAEGRRQSRAALFPAICLLTPQRNHWVYFRRASRRNETGHEGHTQQQQGYPREGRRISRAHTVEQILDDARQGPCTA